MGNVDFKNAAKSNFLSSVGRAVDPIRWMEENFGLEFFSNQIENVESLFDPKIPVFSVLACRGAGKSLGVSAGIAAYCILHPGLRVILAAPKEKQAGRLIKEMVAIFKEKKCKVANQVDWARSSAYRLQFKSGGYVVALSGQEGANIEGEHGHILVIDEAHLVPSYSVTNKLTPMIGMLDISKVVKIGLSMGRNHFFKTCTTPGAVLNKCAWHQAEIFLAHNKPFIWYRGRQYAKTMIDRMPLAYKKQYFPDRPDLHALTGMEISPLDWKTQYELEWADDISNFLSDEEQELLSGGEHKFLVKGMPGELYMAGLDTAQGSVAQRKNTDETVLSVWRKRGDLKEKVACFIWRGDPLAQMDEIWQIINPQTGLFKCQLTLVDYSNIGIAIVEVFKSKHVPIVGKHFQQTESESRKNWKNAMFDYFQVQLQTDTIKYPSVPKLEEAKQTAEGEELVQVKNMLRGFWEWTTLQRVRGRGLNDKIEAPEESVEGEDNGSTRAYDDICCADVMAIWALDKYDSLRADLAASGDLSSYEIPFGLTGVHSLSGASPNAGAVSSNPFAAVAPQPAPPKSPVDSLSGTGYLSDILTNAPKKKI